LIEIL